MAQVILHSDFDGVLNVFPDAKMLRRGGQDRLGWLKPGDPRLPLYSLGNAFRFDRSKRLSLGSPYGKVRIRWSGELADAYRRLVEPGIVELDWLTTWQPFTRLLDLELGWVGLSETVRWYDPVTGAGRLTGKLTAVLRRIEVERDSPDPKPIIWIDDEECHPNRLSDIEAARPAMPVLMVRPDERIGISRRQWALVERFVGDPSGFPMVMLDEEPSIGRRNGHMGL